MGRMEGRWGGSWVENLKKTLVPSVHWSQLAIVLDGRSGAFTAPKTAPHRQHDERRKGSPTKKDQVRIQIRFPGLKALAQIPGALAELVAQAGGAKSSCPGYQAWLIPV